LELSPQLSDVHDIFYIAQLKKCLCMPEEQLPMQELDAKEIFFIKSIPPRSWKHMRVTRNKKIKMCKVQWSHHTEEEATWEKEEEVEFPSFFSDPSESQDKIYFKGGRFVTP
jgi:hypothetical protein